MAYIILMPKISDVTIYPNPVNINQLLTISATVIEEMMELSPAQVYAGTIYAGEVW